MKLNIIIKLIKMILIKYYILNFKWIFWRQNIFKYILLVYFFRNFSFFQKKCLYLTDLRKSEWLIIYQYEFQRKGLVGKFLF